MDVKDVGRAGLVGTRGKLARRFADEVGKRTGVSAETVAAAIGLYLFASRLRRMIQMVRRLRAS